jgi:hypothetical protein
MSSSSSSSSYSRNSTSNAKTLCVVCRDAGKTEKEYTSHFVKDQPGPNGKVVCPTLLNQACRICGKTGHTSSYCSQYRPRRDDYREDRRDDRHREDRREDRHREDRHREDRRDISYNHLNEDTERRERDIRERDDAYHRDQERRSKPWLQAAIKPAAQQQHRREPYAHPHGPRVRLNLETTALCASKHSTPSPAPAPAIDIRKVELHHATNWGDEDVDAPFVCDPAQMTRKFFEEEITAGLTTPEEHEFIAMCDDQSQMPFACGE